MWSLERWTWQNVSSKQSPAWTLSGHGTDWSFCVHIFFPNIIEVPFRCNWKVDREVVFSHSSLSQTNRTSLTCLTQRSRFWTLGVKRTFCAHFHMFTLMHMSHVLCGNNLGELSLCLQSTLSVMVLNTKQHTQPQQVAQIPLLFPTTKMRPKGWPTSFLFQA